MNAQQRISRAFDEALRLPLTPDSRYILFSDCHRGVGNAGDNFLKNEFLYLAALELYFQNGFTYLELGDGDELWENRSVCKIKSAHEQSFAMIARYYKAGRYYALYGNHDIVKRRAQLCRKYFYTCGAQGHRGGSESPERNCPASGQCPDRISKPPEYNFSGGAPLCPGIVFHSGIILQDALRRKDIYLTHGHQADVLNSMLWPLSRFLVRFVWRPLEKLGVPDPTSAAKNNTKKEASEQKLTQWARQNGRLLITGHTHRPMIGTKASPYCNTGSCVSPAGITGLEIVNRCITLVKWSIGTREDMTLYVSREVLGETVCVDEYA